jgi:hypothetical protein
MKIIFSNLWEYRLNESSLNTTFEMAKLSNFLVQNHGYKTCFYGDRKSLEFFSNIKFNEFFELKDERLNFIPHQIWSVGKLFSILNVNEPFIHMDYDIFLFKNFDKNFLNNEVLYYHNEFHLDSLLKEYQSFFQFQPVNTKFFISRSYNCGLLGGKNFKILQRICEEIINFIVDNQEVIRKKLDSKKNLSFASFLPPVLIEQVWIFQLLKYYKQEFTPYLNQTKNLKIINKESYAKNICHLQGWKSNDLVSKNILSMNKYIGI